MLTGAVICFILVDPVFLVSYQHLLTDENLFKLYFFFNIQYLSGEQIKLYKKRGKQKMYFIVGWICKTRFINQFKIAELAIEWL